MAMGMGETLHRSPRNAESFRIKCCTFRLVLPDGGLLVAIVFDTSEPVKYQISQFYHYIWMFALANFLCSNNIQRGTHTISEKIRVLLFAHFYV